MKTIASGTAQFEITEARLSETVIGEAAGVLNATRRQEVGAGRMEWLYRRNPDGEAVLWAIRAAESGELAGFTVALPRRVWVDGREHVCWNGADFSILPKYRTLGLAVKLRRAAKEGIDAGRAEFLYAHPNERMGVIHARVGHSPIGRMVRYARLLRSAGHLEERLKNRWLAKAAAAVVDPALRLQGLGWRHRSTTTVRLIERARFDERFDRLFAETAPANGVIGVRDARYLNWRYAENPLYETHALLAEDGGELRGYLLFVVENEMVSVKDVYPADCRDVVGDLVAAAIREGRRRGVRSVSFTALETNPLIPVFAEFGFRERPGSSEMFGYAAEASPLRARVLDKQAWWVTVGDRDV